MFDSFVLISTNSGINLLLGNSENTTANAGVNVDLSKYYADATHLNEIERDEYFKKQAIKWINNNKVIALKLFCLKIVNYFNYRNDLATKNESNKISDIIMFVTYYPLLLLFIVRLLLIRIYKPNRAEIMLLLLLGANVLLSAVFFTRIRFRLPFDILQIILTAKFMADYYKNWLKKKNNMINNY